MKNIEVFYHLYIPMDERYSMWTWWVDEQIGLLHKRHLTDVANINMCISAPLYWQTLERGEWRLFKDIITYYINNRYPFVNIVDVRDCGERNIYEGQTLSHLYQTCLDKDVDVLYFHSKGISNNVPSINTWRQVLNHFVVERWAKCVHELKDADLVGVKDVNHSNNVVSGNFWWSKSAYIRRLPHPLDVHKYHDTLEHQPGGSAYRHCFEDWVWQGSPKVHHVFDTKIDHYEDLCILEHLPL